MAFSLALLGASTYEAPAVGSYDLLATEILTSSQASITFSSLNSTYGADYDHLQIRYTARTGRGAASDNLIVRFNGVSTASYSHHRLYGDGSSVAAYAGSSATFMYGDATLGSTGTTGSFSGGIIDILDPFETTKNTTIRVLCGFLHSTDQAIELVSGAYYSTDAITSVQILSDSATNLADKCRFSLYGIRKAA
jgi:hypothetical protein